MTAEPHPGDLQGIELARSKAEAAKKRMALDVARGGAIRAAKLPRVISATSVEVGFDVFEACLCCGASWRPDHEPLKHRANCLYHAYERRLQESEVLRSRLHDVTDLVRQLAALVRGRS